MQRVKIAAMSVMISLAVSGMAYAGQWKSDDKGTYYEGQSTYTGWNSIEGKEYYINPEGYTQSGWIQDGSNWYYTDSNGVKVYGWVQVGDKYYFMNKKTGQMQTGWIQDNGAWYLTDGSGAMLTGWQLNGNAWYYLEPNGVMKSNQWYQEGNEWYYLEVGGNMATGWRNINGPYYYFDGSGHMQKGGWITVDSYKYYLRPDGTMVTGEQTLEDGKVYKFGSNGVYLDNVWYNGKWYGSQSNNTKSANVREYKIEYKDDKNKESKPSSGIRNKIESSLNKIPEEILINYFSKNGKVTYFTEKDYIETRKLVYNTYDYDDDGEEYDEDDKYEEVDVTARYTGNRIEFCMEPEGILTGFGYYIDDWMKKNDTSFKSEGISPSQAEEFDTIYDSEYENLVDNIDGYKYDLNEMNQADYFAKSYQLYRQGNKSFVELCPKTNAYIQKIEQQMIYDLNTSKKK